MRDKEKCILFIGLLILYLCNAYVHNTVLPQISTYTVSNSNVLDIKSLISTSPSVHIDSSLGSMLRHLNYSRTSYKIVSVTYPYPPSKSDNQSKEDVQLDILFTTRLNETTGTIRLRTGSHSVEGNTARNIISSSKTKTTLNSTSVLPSCPRVSPNLIGPFEPPYDAPDFAETGRRFPNINPGGSYSPPDCKALHRVAIVVPYRNRSGTYTVGQDIFADMKFSRT